MLTNNKNGKMYVGQTTLSLEKRFYAHATIAKSNIIKKFALHKAMQKYGSDAFSISLLQKCADQQALNEAERSWITKLSTLSPGGYNLSTGGERESGFRHAQSVRDKIANSLRGKHHSEERKFKQSIAAKNRKLTDAGRQAIKLARIGNTNRNPPKPVDKFNIDGNFIRSYESITNAMHDTPGSTISGISACCNRAISFSAGFIWRFHSCIVTAEDVSRCKVALRLMGSRANTGV